VTEPVLDTLRRHDIHATFFVLGKNLADPARKALARRAHRDGHWIGNHTYSHGIPLGKRAADAAVVQQEIGETQALLGELAHAKKFFRPNGGGGALGPHLLSRAAADYLQRDRFTCVIWNAVPRDWEDTVGWVDTALAQCRALPWALVVIHDLPTGAMAQLDAFIRRAKDEGATFRQDFPPDCLPIMEGNPAPMLESFVAG
jgi:peptidoglycan/xylan/chitin deacetylase (PgdA/CDA1 family)